MAVLSVASHSSWPAMAILSAPVSFNLARERHSLGGWRLTHLAQSPTSGLVCGRLLAKLAGMREETMDPDPSALEVDPEELSRYIADRTGIPVEVVARVLEAEMEYLIERGIAQAE